MLNRRQIVGALSLTGAGALLPSLAAAPADGRLETTSVRLVQDPSACALRVPLRLRIGLHSGPLVAGVIGSTKFVYDVWGDTVNTASRMEKLGSPGRIHLSAATQELLGDGFRVEPRGTIPVRGKGEMETYFLEADPVPARASAN